MFDYLQLISPGVHINEVHNNYPGNIAQSQLTGNFCGGFTVRPQNSFTSCGRSRKGTRVHINHRQGFGGFDNDIAPRG